MPMFHLPRRATRPLQILVADLLPQILVPLTAGSLGLLILLTAGLVCERVARNRRERAAWLRRQDYAGVLAGLDAAAIAGLGDSAARSFAARGDLVDAVALGGWSTGPV